MPTALITGASAGLGAEFARQFAARGHDLVLVARDAARLEASAETLRGRGVHVEVLAADLAERADVERVIERLSNAARPVDVLVNNAGFSPRASLLDDDPDDHERTITVMGLAPLLLASAAGRAMASRGHGRIVNVASIAAWITRGSYSAVKAHHKVFSEALSGELAGTGVTVTALCPGWVRTEFHERAGLQGQAASIPGPIWVDAERCVRECLADMDAGRVLSIPTKRWKLAAFGLQHAPRPVIHALGRLLASR